MPLPLYYDSLDTARRQDDVMLWRNSLKENIRCKNAIEKALAENFDGMHLKDGIIPPLAEEYGTDRLTWVRHHAELESRPCCEIRLYHARHRCLYGSAECVCDLPGIRVFCHR